MEGGVTMEYKQVILIRQDLKMPKGKIVAQGAHAAVTATLKADKVDVGLWRGQGMKKVAVKVLNQKELYKYIQQAKDKGLVTAIITDAGRTVVEPGTVTCGAIGPGRESDLDYITGDLPLL